MAVTTTPSMLLLLKQLEADFPNISFKPAEKYFWDAASGTVFYDQANFDDAQLLHEVGHADLRHTLYSRDIELLDMERAAWQVARNLAKIYSISLNEDDVQSHLDTYREWLHARSKCPECESNGVQVADRLYRCSYCLNEWRVNEARTCALRRYQI